MNRPVRKFDVRVTNASHPGQTRWHRERARMRAWSSALRSGYRVVTLVAMDTLAVWVALTLLVPAFHGATVAPVVASAVWLRIILSLAVTGAFGPGSARTSLVRIGSGVALCAGTLGVQATIWGTPVTMRVVLTIAPALLAMVIVGRTLFDIALKWLYRAGVGQIRVVVLGSDTEFANLRKITKSGRPSELKVVGHLPLDFHSGRNTNLGAAVETAARTFGASALIVTSSLPSESLDEVVSAGFEHGLSVALIPRTLQSVSPHFEVRDSALGLLLQLHPRGLGVPQLLVKRAMDLLLSIVILIAAAPLLILIAVAIKLDSPGPILFSQRRVGIGGTAFRMFKFRTMTDDAEQLKQNLQHMNSSGDPRLFKIPDDPRITRVGGFLRRFSMDELPQLLNVLLGDMSLIGPRPFFMEDLEHYEPHHFERLAVLPGITGWWQVKGRSSVIDFEEVVRLDVEYIRNWSIGFDFKVLISTVPAVLRRHGAY